jgi:hypothetical protein
MASNLYTQARADGTSQITRRSQKQGRKSSGLADPKLYRLFAEDVEILKLLEIKLGEYYNENEIVRNAVHRAVESVYTELLKQ